jgi:hypothetical protein
LDTRGVFRSCRLAAAVVVLLGAASPVARAQDASGGDDHQHMNMQNDESASLFPSREGSGTAWLPQLTPMYAFHREAGSWQVMLHGNAFLQYLHDGGNRGSAQTGSVNWLMIMARHEVGAGRVGLRGMFSAEPGTIRGCGYPDLFASGERCGGQLNHDLQHPHDMVMELAAAYVQPISETMNWQVYGGPAGEPALGPVPFPHRPSATANPVAPISHHWLDSTHVSFGVVTGGVYTLRWKAEASVFNGREPDEHRTNIDLGALDSFSGRLWVAPGNRWALQVSAGHLREAEAGETPGVRTDVDRVTASAAYHRPIGAAGLWATTIAWGRNAERGEATSALLVETSAAVNAHDTWYGRFEVNGKTAHDLSVDAEGQVFALSKIQAGYTRYLDSRYGFTPGVGLSGSVGVAPESLASVYGGRVNYGVALYLTLRPAGHRMST